MFNGKRVQKYHIHRIKILQNYLFLLRYFGEIKSTEKYYYISTIAQIII